MSLDPARWEQLAARIRTRWPDQLSNIKSEAYRSALSDLDAKDLGRGVDALIAGDLEQLPTPAELRAAATGPPPADVSGARAGQAAAPPPERRILGIPGSWLLSAGVAIVVAAAIVLIFVFVFRDGTSEPGAFEQTAVENRLVAWDWDSDELIPIVATCVPESSELMGCTVLFASGEEVQVSVTPGDSPGELTIDVPEELAGDGQGGPRSIDPSDEGSQDEGSQDEDAPQGTTPDSP